MIKSSNVRFNEGIKELSVIARASGGEARKVFFRLMESTSFNSPGEFNHRLEKRKVRRAR